MARGWGGARRGRRPQVGRASPSPAGGRGKPRPPGRNFPRPAPARSPQGGLRTRDAAQVDLKGAGDSSARPPRLRRRYSRLSQGHPLIQPGPSERAAGAHLRAAAGPRRGGSRGRRAGGIRGGRAAAPVRHAGGGTVGCGRATGDEARVPGSATTGASFIRAPPSGPRGAAEVSARGTARRGAVWGGGRGRAAGGPRGPRVAATPGAPASILCEGMPRSLACSLAFPGSRRWRRLPGRSLPPSHLEPGGSRDSGTRAGWGRGRELRGAAQVAPSRPAALD